MKRRLFLLGTLCAVLLYSASQYAANTARFTLRDTCPQGFEHTDNNRCEMRSLYQFYDSNQNRGVGGTQTGLPMVRDGFSPQQIDLGRLLFFDPVLSVDGRVSCASCHQPDKGFGDGQAVSKGVADKLGLRSAPSLWNSAFLTSYFWDARSNSLETQAAEALYSPTEMANTPANLIQTINHNPEYQRLFREAFAVDENISLNQLYTALAAFQTSLISLNSRYDRYAHGDHSALNARETAGLNVFRSFVARCAECHTPPLFTNNQIAVIGVPDEDGTIRDVGAQHTFGEAKLKGGFKVPTLRNIVRTAPYMHAGNFTELRDAIEFYNLGRGHAVPENTNLQLHWHITSPDLSDHEIDLLVDFMACLTDEKFTPDIPLAVPSGLSPINPITANHSEVADYQGASQ